MGHAPPERPPLGAPLLNTPSTPCGESSPAARLGQVLLLENNRRDRQLAAIFCANLALWDGNRVSDSETLAMFKLSTYDPVAITFVGFGILLVVALAFAF